MSDADPREDYRRLITDIDRFGETLGLRFPSEITCHLGCTGCCQQHLSVFDIEAANLRDFIRSLDDKRKARLRAQALATLAREATLTEQDPAPARQFPPDPATAVPCPALIDGACAVYDARPVICRTHGFPLFYSDEETDEAFLDVCPLNFSESEDDLESLTSRDVFDMYLVNLRLADANLALLAAAAEPIEQIPRRSIADIILSATDPYDD
jgi:Fe-S-cluster containining protein